MIQQDNLKHFATAAFRYYGHMNIDNKITENELNVILAVSSTLHHLEIEQETVAAESVRQVYYKLPLGNIKRGIMSRCVRRAAYDMHISEGVLWRSLRHARYIFDCYYLRFTLKNGQ